mmetsp:Transcript_62350/g.111092  ORF Transcript_62350/g.111092 Transcript_62350/m.111092 type:complete len:213 (+) Transcript_62350:617-1255(+)
MGGRTGPPGPLGCPWTREVWSRAIPRPGSQNLMYPGLNDGGDIRLPQVDLPQAVLTLGDAVEGHTAVNRDAHIVAEVEASDRGVVLQHVAQLLHTAIGQSIVHEGQAVKRAIHLDDREQGPESVVTNQQVCRVDLPQVEPPDLCRHGTEQFPVGVHIQLSAGISVQVGADLGRCPRPWGRLGAGKGCFWLCGWDHGIPAQHPPLQHPRTSWG